MKVKWKPSQRIGRARDEEARWLPILEADRVGGALPPLTDAEHAELVSGQVERSIALFRAMPDWPDIEPGELLCPALVVVGSENTITMGRLTGQRAVQHGRLHRVGG